MARRFQDLTSRVDSSPGNGRSTIEWFCKTIRLLREAHAAQQVCKARVVSYQVEPGIHPDRGHSVRTLAIGLLKPGKGLFLIS